MSNDHKAQDWRAQYVLLEPEWLSLLRELVAVKEMREEISRRKQRRAYSISKNRAEVRAVANLNQICKVREYRAWNTARTTVAEFDANGFASRCGWVVPPSTKTPGTTS